MEREFEMRESIRNFLYSPGGKWILSGLGILLLLVFLLSFLSPRSLPQKIELTPSSDDKLWAVKENILMLTKDELALYDAGGKALWKRPAGKRAGACVEKDTIYYFFGKTLFQMDPSGNVRNSRELSESPVAIAPMGEQVLVSLPREVLLLDRNLETAKSFPQNSPILDAITNLKGDRALVLMAEADPSGYKSSILGITQGEESFKFTLAQELPLAMGYLDALSSYVLTNRHLLVMEPGMINIPINSVEAVGAYGDRIYLLREGQFVVLNRKLEVEDRLNLVNQYDALAVSPKKVLVYGDKKAAVYKNAALEPLEVPEGFRGIRKLDRTLYYVTDQGMTRIP